MPASTEVPMYLQNTRDHRIRLLAGDFSIESFGICSTAGNAEQLFQSSFRFGTNLCIFDAAYFCQIVNQFSLYSSQYSLDLWS